jgi:RimJ/RimL family protein N-acetyltransferase
MAQVELRQVTREDVGRIAEWLKDPEVAESWFGRYTYGDAAHLGYQPEVMLKASDEEWDAVFRDPHHEPHRDIFSIYTLQGEHIGEGQLSIDEALGDAQLSILIGRKDLWHMGYGTASVLAMLEHVFDHLGLHRVWVDVPEYNSAARAMFQRIGFQHEGTLRQSRPHEGARYNSAIHGMLVDEYRRHFPSGVSSHVVAWGAGGV